jgi:hypothetical protein
MKVGVRMGVHLRMWVLLGVWIMLLGEGNVLGWSKSRIIVAMRCRKRWLGMRSIVAVAMAMHSKSLQQ